MPTVELEVTHRINRPTVDSYFEMQMGPSGQTRRTNFSDWLSSAHALA